VGNGYPVAKALNECMEIVSEDNAVWSCN